MKVALDVFIILFGTQ